MKEEGYAKRVCATDLVPERQITATKAKYSSILGPQRYYHSSPKYGLQHWCHLLVFIARWHCCAPDPSDPWRPFFPFEARSSPFIPQL